MIENEKVGSFLRELREKEGLSQQKLGMQIYVSRQAISQWELGKCFPDLQQAIALSKIYNITIADIYAGEIITNKEKYNSIMEFIIKSEMKRTRKIITLLVTTIIVLLFIFLSYYFFNVYNKISVYTVDTIEKQSVVRGIITKSVNDIYINFELNDTVDNLCLMYNDTKLNCIANNNYLVIKESIGYNEQLPELSHLKMDDFINNLYVEINNEAKIKLKVEKDYNNDKLIFNEDNTTVNYEEKFEENTPDIPENVLKKYRYNEDEKTYTFYDKKKRLNIEYFTHNNTIIFKKEQNDETYKWIYILKNKKLFYYSKTKTKTKEKIIELSDKEITQDIEQNFIENYLNKYFY